MVRTIEIKKAIGLNTQPNDLDVPDGSLQAAENVEITRDGVIEVARGFEDFSENLPDFTPEQIFVFDGVAYAHLDNGIWYHDGTRWLRKRGAFGGRSTMPYGCAFVDGHLYYTANHAVMDLDLSTGRLSVLAGRIGVNASTDGVGDAARFNNPTGIVHDNGSLYVCNQAGPTVRKLVISTRTVTTIAGTAGMSGSTDGTGAAARFESTSLHGITSDGTNLYVCEAAAHTIRQIVISSAVVTTIAGAYGASGTTDAVGTSARFNGPRGIAYDSGNLYIADGSNSTIRKIALASSDVTTFAGTAGASAHLDGTGSGARFILPTSMCSDGTSLFVGSSTDTTVRKIGIADAIVTTPYGQTASIDDDDGIGTAARFDRIEGIAADGTDVLYLCDYTNNLIRKIYRENDYVVTISGVSGTSVGGLPNMLADGIVVGPP